MLDAFVAVAHVDGTVAAALDAAALDDALDSAADHDLNAS